MVHQCISSTVKNNMPDRLLRYIKRFEKQYGDNIAAVHTDGTSKFTVEVETSTTTTYTPESNRLAKQAHRIILSIGRTVLSQAGLPE